MNRVKTHTSNLGAVFITDVTDSCLANKTHYNQWKKHYSVEK